MNYIVYKTTNLLDGRFYVGVHGTKDPDIFDGYFGSGKYLISAIRKYGKEYFIRETLINCFEDAEEAYSIEALLVKTKNEDPRSYNLKPGGYGNPDLAKYASEAGKKSAELGVGYHKFTKEEKSEFGKLGGRIAVERQVGIHDPNNFHMHAINGSIGGILGGNKCVDENLGIHGMSDEDKTVARSKGGKTTKLENKGIHTTDLELKRPWLLAAGKSSKDSIFFNDGIRNSKFVPKSHNITFEEFLIQNPQFTKGKIYIKSKSERKNNSGKICYNDGINEFKLSYTDPLKIEEEFAEFIKVNPQFVRGRLSQPFKNKPEARLANLGTKFYNDGVKEMKFKSSDPLNKQLTDVEFSEFLILNKDIFIRGRIKSNAISINK